MKRPSIKFRKEMAAKLDCTDLAKLSELDDQLILDHLYKRYANDSIYVSILLLLFY